MTSTANPRRYSTHVAARLPLCRRDPLPGVRPSRAATWPRIEPGRGEVGAAGVRLACARRAASGLAQTGWPADPTTSRRRSTPLASAWEHIVLTGEYRW